MGTNKDNKDPVIPYIVLADMKVEKAFDDKYKTSLPKVMKKALETAIGASNSGLTNKKPTTPGFKTYSIDATVTSLVQNGKNLEATLSMAASENNFAFGFSPNNHGKMPASSNPKDLDDDVEFLVTKLMKDSLTKTTGPAIKKRANPE